MRTFTVATLLLALPAAAWIEPAAPLPLHPHFQKKVECRLSDDLLVSVMYQTATFNREGAEKMQPGGTWHLAGTQFQTSKELTVGGQKVAAGLYSLRVRKTGKSWELLLDKCPKFSRKLTDAAQVLETMHDPKAPLHDHLSVDIHPAGDDGGPPKMYLDVRFDTHLARCEITLPEQPRRQRRNR